MGIDKSLSDHYPSVVIGGKKYHYGRELVDGQYLVENVDYAKDYWCFDKKEDLVAFLVNLPESADRSRRRALYPDWDEVTHEQRTAYIEEDRARLRTLAGEKVKAGTAPIFDMDFEVAREAHAPREHELTDDVEARSLVNDYWAERIRLKDHRASIRVDGVQYFVGPEDGFSLFRGHDGEDFYIKFAHGRLVHSTNLWRNGHVPEAYKTSLPDNAEFVSKEEFHRLAEKVAQEKDGRDMSKPGRISPEAPPTEGHSEQPNPGHEQAQKPTQSRGFRRGF